MNLGGTGKSLFGALAIAGIMGAAAMAQDAYPTQPVHIIVPFAAGSATDIVTRIAAEKIQQQTGHVFVVENMPGGNGIIGSTTGARAEPDGYTLTIGGAGHFSGNTVTTNNLPYDIFEDFVPIHGLTRAAQFIVVNADFPADSISELIEIAQADPGTLTFGPANQIGRMAVELLRARAEIDMRYIPYTSMEQALVDVVNGQVTMTVGSAPVLPFIETGQVKALGISGPTPGNLLPDVRPIADALPDFEVRSWLGVVAPAGTPEPILETIEELFSDAMNDPELQERLQALGMEPWLVGPEAFAATMREDLELWREFVEVADIPMTDQ